MKTFKIFSGQLDELKGVAPKAKGEHKFVHTTYMAQVKDPGDLEKVGPEEVGPADTKSGQGKRPADRLDNKQKFAENSDASYKDEDDKEEKKEKRTMKSFKATMEADSHQAKTTMKHITKPTAGEKKAAKDIKPGTSGYADRVAMLKSAKARGALKEDEVDEALHDNQKQLDVNKNGKLDKDDFTKLRGKKVKEAYGAIKAKLKEDADVELLFKLYEELSEENQEMFLTQLEEDADLLLGFAKELVE